MSRISGEFARTLARVWHRFDPGKQNGGQDMGVLADMLAPMDEAGETLAEKVGFDMEPADYLKALEDLADPIVTPGRPDETNTDDTGAAPRQSGAPTHE